MIASTPASRAIVAIAILGLVRGGGVLGDGPTIRIPRAVDSFPMTGLIRTFWPVGADHVVASIVFIRVIVASFG